VWKQTAKGDDPMTMISSKVAYLGQKQLICPSVSPGTGQLPDFGVLDH
jgi:hypothetical protein